ncbi:unnamed protein product, partial [Iphiclides podalirius]
MEGHLKMATFISLITALCGASSAATREERTGSLLSEKILGGVIDIVHSHKNKPTPQPQVVYQQAQQYPQQYPQYQQWNGPGYQGSSYSQYQGQSQYGYAPQNGHQSVGYPQNGGSYSGQAYPASQGFSNQGTSQGQYQTGYQPPNGPYQQTQSTQFQQGQYAGSTGQYYGQGSQASLAPGAGQGGAQGFQVTGGGQAGSGPGPACVCQAWTKPQHDPLHDSPTSEKMEKIHEKAE